MHLTTKKAPVDAHSLQHQTQCRCLVPRSVGRCLTKGCATKQKWKIYIVSSLVALEISIVIEFLAFLVVYYPTFMLSHHVGLYCSQDSSTMNRTHTSVHSRKFIFCHCSQAWYFRNNLVDSNGIYSLQPLGSHKYHRGDGRTNGFALTSI